MRKDDGAEAKTAAAGDTRLWEDRAGSELPVRRYLAVLEEVSREPAPQPPPPIEGAPPGPLFKVRIERGDTAADVRARLLAAVKAALGDA